MVEVSNSGHESLHDWDRACFSLALWVRWVGWHRCEHLGWVEVSPWLGGTLSSLKCRLLCLACAGWMRRRVPLWHASFLEVGAFRH